MHTNQQPETEPSEQTVEAMTNAVWQSLSDKQLVDLTERLFRACVAGFEATDEEVGDAWAEFAERRDRVFH